MGERLRRARAAKGWSQSRLLYEIEGHARRKALGIATAASLKVYISEWENDRRAITQPYRAILRSLFGMTDEELFGSVPATLALVDGYDELISRIESAHAVSRTVVATFVEQTEAFRTLDRQIGASQLVDSMGRHLATLSDALAFAVLPDARRPVAEALAGAATLAAWQALDVGAVDRAWRHYELAKQAAREAGQPRYLAHAMGEQAYVLADLGQTELATQLVDEALQVGDTAMPPRLLAWLHSAGAELNALGGDRRSCLRHLDLAASVIPADDLLRDPEMPSIFLTEGHLARWRGHSLALIGDEQAISDLYEALDKMDPTFVRAQAGLRCDLAQAHFVRSEYAEATEHLRTARTLANRTGSVRYRRRIERLTGQI